MEKAKIVIPINAFIIKRKQKGVLKDVKMTLNNWILIHGMPHGRIVANTYKHKIQDRIIDVVSQSIVDGLPPIEEATTFNFDWYLPDRKTDLDNWTFTHKFIFDAFQNTTVRGIEFMPNDNLNYVHGLLDRFAGIDKENARVEISWKN
ncbi:Protein gp63 [Bacteriophage A118] [Weissella confusa]|uniref:hypothetical protein n=1 Tax=Weissella confusa TaxID=1583 RepID=UPI000989A807|nr:hypothetical protein [Weissella confusa]SJX69500.1 Protein gp63 [Bacteriophage A118] [Weissella confusa]